MSAEVARILRDAADLIEPPGRWTRGTLARDEHGLPVAAESPDAVCWCALGAVQRVASADTNARWDALEAIEAIVAEPAPISHWNDRQPSAALVISVLRDAADEEEAL